MAQPKGDVFPHGHAVEQGKVLVNHADAQCFRSLGRGDAGFIAFPDDATAVGLGLPGQHLHQGRFAGPVFAKEGVDLTGLHVEVHGVIGQDPGVGFRDAL